MNLMLKAKERNLETHLDPKEWNKLIKKKRYSYNRYKKTF